MTHHLGQRSSITRLAARLSHTISVKVTLHRAGQQARRVAQRSGCSTQIEPYMFTTRMVDFSVHGLPVTCPRRPRPRVLQQMGPIYGLLMPEAIASFVIAGPLAASLEAKVPQAASILPQAILRESSPMECPCGL